MSIKIVAQNGRYVFENTDTGKVVTDKKGQPVFSADPFSDLNRQLTGRASLSGPEVDLVVAIIVRAVEDVWRFEWARQWDKDKSKNSYAGISAGDYNQAKSWLAGNGLDSASSSVGLGPESVRDFIRKRFTDMPVSQDDEQTRMDEARIAWLRLSARGKRQLAQELGLAKTSKATT